MWNSILPRLQLLSVLALKNEKEGPGKASRELDGRSGCKGINPEGRTPFSVPTLSFWSDSADGRSSARSGGGGSAKNLLVLLIN
ncbi:hypothetical protein KQX54_012379 [Cotesia glomerata]|uniref:Uncharacterized protein n=1 Tax=Cotesia glomerata TaxID=32391 RepID=A0AAV7IU68_COTGL|nr:hypothetical protein KQX54_012379 [Cotesia glomerata]